MWMGHLCVLERFFVAAIRGHGDTPPQGYTPIYLIPGRFRHVYTIDHRVCLLHHNLWAGTCGNSGSCPVVWTRRRKI
jgi:hypothetical protein